MSEGPPKTCGTCRHDTSDHTCETVEERPVVARWAEQWWSDRTKSVRVGAPPCPGWEPKPETAKPFDGRNCPACPGGWCDAPVCAEGCNGLRQAKEAAQKAPATPAQPSLPLRLISVEVPACQAIAPSGEQCGLPEGDHLWHVFQAEGRCRVWRVNADESVTTWAGGAK